MTHQGEGPAVGWSTRGVATSKAGLKTARRLENWFEELRRLVPVN